MKLSRSLNSSEELPFSNSRASKLVNFYSITGVLSEYSNPTVVSVFLMNQFISGIDF